MSDKKKTLLEIAEPILKAHQKEAENLELENIDDLTEFLNAKFKFQLGLITEDEETEMTDEVESRMILRDAGLNLK